MMLTNLLSQLSEKKFGGVTVSVHRVNRRARRSRHVGPTQSISIRLKMQRQHLKLLILGLGCGKSAGASLHSKKARSFWYLGSGAGFDCFLAARRRRKDRKGNRRRYDARDAKAKHAKTRKRTDLQTLSSGWAKSKRCRWRTTVSM